MVIRHDNGVDGFPNTISEAEQEDDNAEYKSSSNHELTSNEETKSNDKIRNRYDEL